MEISFIMIMMVTIDLSFLDLNSHFRLVQTTLLRSIQASIVGKDVDIHTPWGQRRGI